MKKVLIKFLPSDFIKLLKEPSLFLSHLLKNNIFLIKIYYLIFSKTFNREMNSIINGISEYKNNLTEIQESSYLLRRNIHRIEKGLIMVPRREIFAEAYIEETVNIFNKAFKFKEFNKEEIKWASDVLIEYFDKVSNSEKIDRARIVFYNSPKNSCSENKFIPYKKNLLNKNKLKFNDLKELILNRNSIRWYKNMKVSNEIVQKAIDIASSSPSACNRQPYSFYVSQNAKKAAEIAKLAGGTGGWYQNIPCTIVVVGDLSAYPREKDRHIIYIDSSLATMQLILTFEALGLSSCCINWPEDEERDLKMSKLLSLKPFERPVMLLSVGYGLDSGGIPFSQKKMSKVLLKKVL